MNEATAKELWDKLDSRRQGALRRAREAAEVTIPGILPPEGHDETNTLPTPYQGLGARGVNNLSSKLLMTMIPPNETFFKLEPDSEVMSQLEERDPKALSDAKERLSGIEQAVLSEVESGNYRAYFFEALRHLVCVGNVMVHLPPDGGMKLYRLDQYVVRRDRAGNVLDQVIKEQVSPAMLDDKTIDTCKVDTADEYGQKNVEVFTHVKRKGKQWKVSQEINGVTVPGSEGKHPLEKPAFLTLRWTAVPGEDYGRGLVEEHLGDLRSLEGISKAMVRFAANASKIVWLTNPNGLTNSKKLARAESGEFVSGREQDVTLLQMDKFADFKVVKETEADIAQRLSQAFLLNASIQRDAERVTAAEIQVMAQELEDALGGVYSILAQEFQLPFLKRVMATLQKRSKIPELPSDIVKTKITTGLEALGRGHDLQKLTQSLKLLSETVPPEILAKKIDWDDLITRVFAAQGVNTSGLIKDGERQQQESRQQQIQQLAQDAGPEVAKEIAKQQAPQGGQSG